jgi:hypothetical protein
VIRSGFRIIHIQEGLLRSPGAQPWSSPINSAQTIGSPPDRRICTCGCKRRACTPRGQRQRVDWPCAGSLGDSARCPAMLYPPRTPSGERLGSKASTVDCATSPCTSSGSDLFTVHAKDWRNGETATTCNADTVRWTIERRLHSPATTQHQQRASPRSNEIREAMWSLSKADLMEHIGKLSKAFLFRTSSPL